MLPQKKRALVTSPGSTNNNSAAEANLNTGKKFAKLNNNNASEECVDDETLIRETEAALKNLSGKDVTKVYLPILTSSKRAVVE